MCNQNQYKYPSKEYLYQEYIINNKSRKQIAEENGVSEATIKTHLYEKGIKKNTNKISKETLEELYLKTDNSIADVARILHTNDRLVSEYLDKYDIKKDRYLYNIYNKANDDEWIRLYVNEHLSAYAIAKLYNTSHTVVIRHLQRCGINTRTRQIAQRVINGNYNINPDILNYDVMFNLHIVKRLGVGVIADMYKCSITNVMTSLHNLSIPVFNSNTANLAPNTGYVTKHNFEPSLSQRMRYYCVKNLNPIALQRDNYTCRKCGSKENLQVHHAILSLNRIMYIIVDMHPELSIVDNIDELFNISINDPLFLDIDNLSTLCSKCHYEFHKIYGYY